MTAADSATSPPESVAAEEAARRRTGGGRGGVGLRPRPGAAGRHRGLRRPPRPGGRLLPAPPGRRRGAARPAGRAAARRRLARRLRPRHVSPLAAHLAAAGFAVASVEYRRGAPRGPAQPDGQAPRRPGTARPPPGAGPTPSTTWPPRWTPCPELAVVALGARAVDARRTVLTGHSAGGHLALWAAARHVLPPASPWHLSSPPPLRGVVALAPIADFDLGDPAARLLRCGGRSARWPRPPGSPPPPRRPGRAAPHRNRHDHRARGH